jgi:hypothetical protein
MFSPSTPTHTQNNLDLLTVHVICILCLMITFCFSTNSKINTNNVRNRSEPAHWEQSNNVNSYNVEHGIEETPQPTVTIPETQVCYHVQYKSSPKVQTRIYSETFIFLFLAVIVGQCDSVFDVIIDFPIQLLELKKLSQVPQL